MIEPMVLNIEAYRNASLRTRITLMRDGTAFDLTGHNIYMQVRQKPNDAILASANSLGQTPDGSIVDVIAAAGGVFEIVLTNLDFQDINLPPGTQANDKLVYAYDVVLVKISTGDRMVAIRGAFNLNPGITIAP